MDALPSESKRKPISPLALIRVYEDMETRLADSVRRADRIAFLMCRSLEEVLDAARACGFSVKEDNPAFSIDEAIDIICMIYGLDKVRDIERRVPSVNEYRYTDFIDHSGDHPKYLKGPFEPWQIAKILGLEGIWEVHRVITVAWNIGFYGDTYTGQQAIAITKELERNA